MATGMINDSSKIYIELAIWIVFSAAVYMVSVLLAKRVFPNTRDIFFAADAIFGIVYYPLLVVLALDATSKLHVNVETRWFGFTESSKLLALAITSRMLVHIFYIELKKLTFQEKKMMRLHHILCITVYSTGLIKSQCHFWGSFAAMCETSNVFLNNLELWKSASDFSRNERVRIVHTDYHILYKINIALLLVSFTLFRLVLFPTLLFVWLADVYSFPEMAWEHPNLSFMERFIHPMTAIIMLCLSVRWFIPLSIETMTTLGFARVVPRDEIVDSEIEAFKLKKKLPVFKFD